MNQVLHHHPTTITLITSLRLACRPDPYGPCVVMDTYGHAATDQVTCLAHRRFMADGLYVCSAWALRMQCMGWV